MTIEQKLEQLYEALREMHVTDKLPSIKPTTKSLGNQFVASIDFTTGVNQASAANRVSILLNNIACLKDHLKSWCQKNRKPFTGDQLINTNKDVAIIHDLWNLDKHAEIDRSRSGLFPRLLRPAQTSLVMRGGSEPLSISISLFGQGVVQTQGDVRLSLDAPVVGENGK